MIEKIKALSTKDKLIAMALAVLLVDSFLGWRFLWVRDLQTIRMAETRIQTSKKKQTVISNIAAAENRLKKYNALLSESSEVEWLIERVNQLISGTGLALVSASPQALKIGPDYDRVSLSLEASGGFHSLGKFIERVENNSPLIKITSLRIERGQGVVGQQSLRVTLLLNAYYPVGGKKA